MHNLLDSFKDNKDDKMKKKYANDLKFLLKLSQKPKGDNNNLKNSSILTNKDQDTPLSYAIKNLPEDDIDKIADSLLTEESVGVKNKDAQYPLHLAFKKLLSPKLITKIYEKEMKKDIKNKKDKDENKPIQYSGDPLKGELLNLNKETKVDHLNKLFEYLDAIDEPKNVVNKDGNNILHIAIEKDNREIIQFLVNYNNEYLLQSNKSGNLPLHATLLSPNKKEKKATTAKKEVMPVPQTKSLGQLLLGMIPKGRTLKKLSKFYWNKKRKSN